MLRYDGYKNLLEPVSHLVSCVGPRGVPINESHEDAIWAYPGKANGEIVFTTMEGKMGNLTMRRRRGTYPWFI